tara:strand:- start:2579 stop:2803 length:225 start_codon:yes stop_codon:yes gene_type:complete
MFIDIQTGDTVYFSTPHTTEMKGRAVMRGPHGWVVNMGGRHGMPGVVTERNYIKHRKGRNRKPDHIGNFLSKIG